MDYKLGKRPFKEDARTIRLQSILKALPPIPDAYDVDAGLGAAFPLPVFGNDKWGDCVVAGRAHHTLRLEKFEQNIVLNISQTDVLKDYWREQGASCLNPHPDKGLVVLDSLKSWRKKGWKAAGKAYDIYAFAQVNQLNHQEIDAAIYLLNGAELGLDLPESAKTEFENGESWDVTDDAPGSWGGHLVYVKHFEDKGPVCVTWGKLQPMTWAFVDKYCDEAWAVVDNRDRFLTNSPVDVVKLDEFLKEITG